MANLSRHAFAALAFGVCQVAWSGDAVLAAQPKRQCSDSAVSMAAANAAAAAKPADNAGKKPDAKIIYVSPNPLSVQIDQNSTLTVQATDDADTPASAVGGFARRSSRRCRNRVSRACRRWLSPFTALR